MIGHLPLLWHQLVRDQFSFDYIEQNGAKMEADRRSVQCIHISGERVDRRGAEAEV